MIPDCKHGIPEMTCGYCTKREHLEVVRPRTTGGKVDSPHAAFAALIDGKIPEPALTATGDGPLASYGERTSDWRQNGESPILSLVAQDRFGRTGMADPRIPAYVAWQNGAIAWNAGNRQGALALLADAVSEDVFYEYGGTVATADYWTGTLRTWRAPQRAPHVIGSLVPTPDRSARIGGTPSREDRMRQRLVRGDDKATDPAKLANARRFLRTPEDDE